MDDRFITIVRRHLPLLSSSEELPLDTPLFELGLSSMSMVALAIDLELELGISLPQERLTHETFADTSILWIAVSSSMRS